MRIIRQRHVGRSVSISRSITMRHLLALTLLFASASAIGAPVPKELRKKDDSPAPLKLTDIVWDEPIHEETGRTTQRMWTTVRHRNKGEPNHSQQQTPPREAE